MIKCNHRYFFLAIFLCISVCLTGCETDSNRVVSSINSDSSISDIKFAAVESDVLETYEDPNSYVPPEIIISRNNSVGSGETAKFAIEEYGEIDYCLNDVKIYQNLFDAGLTSGTLFDRDVGLIDSYGNLSNGYSFLVFDISVTNVDVKDKEQHAHVLGLCELARNKTSAEIIEIDPYFLNSEYEFGDSHYYHFNVEIGQTYDIFLGWVLDTNIHKQSDLFLSIGADFGIDAQHSDPRKYIKVF